MTTVEEEKFENQPQIGGLKRKSENEVEEQNIEVGIKRVALNDDNSISMSATLSSKQQSEEVDKSDSTDHNDINSTTSTTTPISTSQNNDATCSNDYVYLRMLCLVKDAAVIVGHKGETINNIKRESLAKINVSSNLRDIPERVLFVRGSCENVSKACYSISKCLIDHKTKKKHSPESAPVNGDGDNIDNVLTEQDNKQEKIIESSDQLPSPSISKQLSQENLSVTVEETKNKISTITINLLIPHYIMGYIIGKNGSVLKEIEEKGSVKLQASPHRLLPSTDRILRITGSPDSIRIATLHVAHIINSHKEKLKNKKNVPYQPGPMYSVLGQVPFIPYLRMSDTNSNNKKDKDAPLSTSFSSPSSFSSSSSTSASLPYQIPQSVMGSIRYYNGNKMKPYYKHCNSRRVPSAPMVMLIPSVDPQSTGATNIPPPGYVKLPSTVESNVVYTVESAANATTFVPNMTLPNVRIEDKTIPTQPMAIIKQSLYIDENFVGNVIGKEGKHINSIKDTTGCSVVIDDPVKGSKERKLSIEGTYMGVQAAIMLISNKIEVDKFNQNKTKWNMKLKK